LDLLKEIELVELKDDSTVVLMGYRSVETKERDLVVLKDFD
jgi:hypothetical protein